MLAQLFAPTQGFVIFVSGVEVRERAARSTKGRPEDSLNRKKLMIRKIQIRGRISNEGNNRFYDYFRDVSLWVYNQNHLLDKSSSLNFALAGARFVTYRIF